MGAWDTQIETWPQERLRQASEALEALVASPGWAILVERAEQERYGVLRRIEQGDPAKHAEMARNAGHSLALRLFMERPAQIIAKARAVYAEREQRASEAEAQEDG